MMRVLCLGVAGLLTGLLLLTSASLAHAADGDLPIFDTHLHYSSDAWSVYSPEEILSLLDQAGIVHALVSSTPDDGTLTLHRMDPERIIPVLRPYRTRADMTTWTRDSSVLEYVQQRLPGASYVGLGEFHLSATEVDNLVVYALAGISAAHGHFLHAHTDAAGVDRLARTYPDARILWAHAGMSASASSVGRVIQQHPNVWVELALRYDVAPGGRLDPAWSSLFQSAPDRFMIGTDTWIPSQWIRLPGLMAEVRGWLGQLPSNVAEAVAFRNGDRLFRGEAIRPQG